MVEKRNDSDFYLDCKGLSCPMPIVKLSREFKKLKVGQTLKVDSTDKAFLSDVTAWCEKMDQTLVSFKDEKEFFQAVIKKEK